MSNSDNVVYGRFGMRKHHKTEQEMAAEDALVDQLAAQMNEEWGRHENHRREQIGRCIYCRDCGVRRGQGRLDGPPLPDPFPVDAP